jgi:hypothetical protein
MENSFHFFPLWKRGKKGDLTAFQKAKLLRKKRKHYRHDADESFAQLHKTNNIVISVNTGIRY